MEPSSQSAAVAPSFVPEHLKNVSSTVWQRAAAIRLLVLDVDGVLTDGGVFFDAEDEAIKRFHTLDGQGIKWLQQTGLQVAVVTGRDSQPLRLRLGKLGVELVTFGCTDKWPAVQGYMQQLQLSASAVAYMGDDWPDLAPMQHVGLACAPRNAHAELRQRAHYVAAEQGGFGAVRAVADVLLTAQGAYQNILARYLDAKVPSDDRSASGA